MSGGRVDVDMEILHTEALIDNARWPIVPWFRKLSEGGGSDENY